MRAIATTNHDAVKKALDQINGRAFRFTINSAREVEAIALRAVAQFDIHQLPRRVRAGAAITYRPAGPRFKAYRFSPISTRLSLRVGRDGKKLYLVGVDRVRVYPSQRELLTIALTPRAHGEFMQQRSKIFSVTSDRCVAFDVRNQKTPSTPRAA